MLASPHSLFAICRCTAISSGPGDSQRLLLCCLQVFPVPPLHLLGQSAGEHWPGSHGSATSSITFFLMIHVMYSCSSAGHYHFQSNCCRWQVRHGVCCCISKAMLHHLACCRCCQAWLAYPCLPGCREVVLCNAFCFCYIGFGLLCNGFLVLQSEDKRLHRQSDSGLCHSEQSWPSPHTVSPALSLLCRRPVRPCSTHNAASLTMLLTCCQTCCVALHAVSPSAATPIHVSHGSQSD